MKVYASTFMGKSASFATNAQQQCNAVQCKGYPARTQYAVGPTGSKKINNTGLPGNLKAGIESIAGYSMDDVKVHYNSDKAAQVNALAYAQGTDVYLGPGQEKHLPHEAWHIVQQKQGRVQPTMQSTGIPINDNVALEREADVMGARASHHNFSILPRTEKSSATKASTGNVVQRNKLKTFKNIMTLGIRKAYVRNKRKKRAAALTQNNGTAGNSLDSFVKAYEKARYYHKTDPGNLNSIDQGGLLNYEDRVRILGGDVRGMSGLGGEFAGDEKKGVFLGPKGFMQENRMTENVVRAYLGSNRTILHHWDETDVPSQELMRDEKFRGGAVITKDSVPSGQLTTKRIDELLDNDDPKLDTILAQIGSQYEGNPPELDEMKVLLKRAVLERRLSNVAFDTV